MKEDFRKAAGTFIGTANAVLDDLSDLLSDVADKVGNASKDFLGKLKPYERKETETSTILEFNFAGYEKDEIHIKIDEGNHTLTVHAKKAGDDKKFSRLFNLPRANKAKDIKSTYKNGILTISIKKIVPPKTAEKDIVID